MPRRPSRRTVERERLACLVLDDPRSVALGNEPVKDGSVVVGRVTSGGLGYSLGLSIAYAWLPADLTRPGTRLVVEVFGQSVGAEVRKDPLYDPKGERIRVSRRTARGDRVRPQPAR